MATLNQQRIPALRGKLPIVVDTAEQLPYVFPTDRVEVIRHVLPAGDYALAGFEEDGVLWEKKEDLDELVSWLFNTKNRERAFREIRELARARMAGIICVGSWKDILDGKFRNDVHPDSVIGMLNAITMRFKVITVLMPTKIDAMKFVLASFEQFAKGMDKKFRRLAHTLILGDSPELGKDEISGRARPIKKLEDEK